MAVLIVLAVGGLSALLVTRSSREQPPGATAPPVDRRCGVDEGLVSVGERLPDDCVFETVDGGRFVPLGEFQGGEPMVLNFWASWCVFCIKEMPDFQRVYAELDGRVRFLGLDLLAIQGETRAAATALARQTAVRYPLGYDEGALLYARLSPRFLMPTTVLVRADGTVVFRQFGPLDASGLRSLIRTHLDVEA